MRVRQAVRHSQGRRPSTRVTQPCSCLRRWMPSASEAVESARSVADGDIRPRRLVEHISVAAGTLLPEFSDLCARPFKLLGVRGDIDSKSRPATVTPSTLTALVVHVLSHKNRHKLA